MLRRPTNGARADGRRWSARRILHGVLKYGPPAAADCVIVWATYLLAVGFRTGGKLDTPDPGQAVIVMAFEAGLLQVAANLFFNVYWRDWSVAALEDLVALAKSTGAVAIVLAVTETLADFHPIPYTAIVAGASLALVAQAAVKLRPRWSALLGAELNRPRGEEVLVVGAGRVGQLFARDLSDGSRGYRIAGFADDDPQKWGWLVRGIRVLGGVDDLPELIGRLHPAAIVIAIAHPPGSLVRKVVDVAVDADVAVRAVSGFAVWSGGRGSGSPLREIGIEELLARDPVPLVTPATREYLTGRTVLVTGAAGSIGSEICRQVARLQPKVIAFVDINESGLHDLVMSIGSDAPTELLLGDIRDRGWLRSVFQRIRPDVVFHAAAYKHVPIIERSPLPGIAANVIGTANVLAEAIAARTQRFVFISSDKAVTPINVLGCTKRFGELLTAAYARASGRAYAVVRFGNVLGSSGSVIPTFNRQIERGGPITVTHADATRYFMTVEEAAGLVIQAGAIAEGGDLLVLDMGRPVPIVELAQRMARLRGLRIPTDIGIEFTGLRSGEKLHEELHFPDEVVSGTNHPRIARVASGPRGPALGTLQSGVQEIDERIAAMDAQGATTILRTLIDQGVVEADGSLISHAES